MKRTVEITDILQEQCEAALEEVIEFMVEGTLDGDKEHWREEDDPPEVDGDRVSEITDQCTPIYYHEIDGAWFLYSDDLEQAIEDSGLGEDGVGENRKQVGIYLYIEQYVYSHYQEAAQTALDEWKEALTVTAKTNQKG